MKLNVLFLTLLLIASIKSNNVLDPYSIEGFKEYLIENGLFEIIQTIKYFFGQDVAIICCEELNPNYNGNCKKLVTDYMEEMTENTDEDEDESNKNPKENVEESNTESLSKSDSSKSQYDQPPKNPIEKPLNNRKKIRFSKILKMRQTLNNIYTLKELISIFYKIEKRVINLLSYNLSKELLAFLKSLFGISIKI